MEPDQISQQPFLPLRARWRTPEAPRADLRNFAKMAGEFAKFHTFAAQKRQFSLKCAHFKTVGDYATISHTGSEGEGFPYPTGERHCVNSCALAFRPNECAGRARGTQEATPR